MKFCKSHPQKRRWTQITLMICLILLSAGCVRNPITPYTAPLLVGNNKIFVQVVKTPEELTKGLSGREKLTDDQGMLFIFDRPGNYGFWMKEIKFDLDLIWIKENKIIGITPNVPHPQSADEKLPLYRPPSLIDTVL